MTDHRAMIDALRAAHLAGTRIAPPSVPTDREAILAIQAAVCDGLGGVAGFKVGSGKDGPPVVAPVLSRYAVPNGGKRKIGDRLGVELEVGFEVIRPLPENGFPAQPQAYFRPCVVLELVDTRLSGPLADDPLCKFADFQINAGVVIGDGLGDWDGSDFDTVFARLMAEGSTILDGEARVPGGSALENLRLLVHSLGTHCGGLQPGQVVITGSLCGLPYFGPGTRVEGHIGGLGAVAVDIA